MADNLKIGIDLIVNEKDAVKNLEKHIKNLKDQAKNETILLNARVNVDREQRVINKDVYNGIVDTLKEIEARHKVISKFPLFNEKDTANIKTWSESAKKALSDIDILNNASFQKDGKLRQQHVSPNMAQFSTAYETATKSLTGYVGALGLAVEREKAHNESQVSLAKKNAIAVTVQTKADTAREKALAKLSTEAEKLTQTYKELKEAQDLGKADNRDKIASTAMSLENLTKQLIDSGGAFKELGVALKSGSGLETDYVKRNIVELEKELKNLGDRYEILEKIKQRIDNGDIKAPKGLNEKMGKTMSEMQAASSSIKNLKGQLPNLGANPIDLTKYVADLTRSNIALQETKVYWAQIQKEINLISNKYGKLPEEKFANVGRNEATLSYLKERQRILTQEETSLRAINEKLQVYQSKLQTKRLDTSSFTATRNEIERLNELQKKYTASSKEEKWQKILQQEETTLQSINEKLRTQQAILQKKKIGSSEFTDTKKEIERLNELQKKYTTGNDDEKQKKILKHRETTLQSINEKLKIYQSLLQTKKIDSVGFDKARKEIERLSQLQQKYNTEIRASSNEYEKQSRLMSNLKTMAAQYVSIYAVRNVLSNIIDVTGAYEKQRIALGALIKDNIKANMVFEQTKELAVKSPFQVKELVTYIKELASFRIENDKLFGTMSQLADVSAGLGVDMSRLILAYGQVKAATVLRGQELRQFTEAGLPIVDMLAEKFSILKGEIVSTADVFELISDRAVPFKMIEGIFNDLTSAGGMFFGMQEKLADTISGKISNLKDQYDILFDTVGRNNNGIINLGIGVATSFAKMYNTFAVIPPVLNAVALSFAAVAIQTLLATKAITSNAIAEKANLIATKASTVERKASVLGKIQDYFATRTSTAELKNKTAAEMLSKISTEKMTVVQRAYAISLVRSATASNIFTKGLFAMKAAILSNPIGLFVALLTASVMGIVKVFKYFKSVQEQYDKMAESARNRMIALQTSIGETSEMVNRGSQTKATSEEVEVAIDSILKLAESDEYLSGVLATGTEKIKDRSELLKVLKKNLDYAVEGINNMADSESTKRFTQNLEGGKYFGWLIGFFKDFPKEDFIDFGKSMVDVQENLNKMSANKDNDVIIKTNIQNIRNDFEKSNKTFSETRKYLADLQKAGLSLKGTSAIKTLNEAEKEYNTFLENTLNMSLDSYKKLDISDKARLKSSVSGSFKAWLEGVKGFSTEARMLLENQLAKDLELKIKVTRMDDSVLGANLKSVTPTAISDEEAKQVSGNIVKAEALWQEKKKQQIDEEKVLNSLTYSRVSAVKELNKNIREENSLTAKKKEILDKIKEIDKKQVELQKTKTLTAKKEYSANDGMIKNLKQEIDLDDARLKTLKQTTEFLRINVGAGQKDINVRKEKNKIIGDELDAVASIYGFSIKEAKKSGGSTEDPFIQLMKDRMKYMEDFEKGTKDLQKLYGQTKGLTNEQNIMAPRGATLGIDSKQLKGTTEELLKWYDNAIKKIAERGGLSGKVFEGLGVEAIMSNDMISKVSKKYRDLLQDMYKAKTDFETKVYEDEERNRLDSIKKTFDISKLRSELYEDLGGEFSESMALNLSLSLYGDGALDISEQLQQSLQDTLGEGYDISIDGTPFIDIAKIESAIQNMEIGSDVRKQADEQLKIYKESEIKKLKSLTTAYKEEKNLIYERQDIVRKWAKDEIELERQKVMEIARIRAKGLAPEEEEKVVQKIETDFGAVKERGQRTMNAELGKNEYDQFKGSPLWEQAFADLDRVSGTTLQMLKEKLTQIKDVMLQSNDIIGLKEVVKQLEEIEDRTISFKDLWRNAFKVDRGAINAIKEELEKARTLVGSDNTIVSEDGTIENANLEKSKALLAVNKEIAALEKTVSETGSVEDINTLDKKITERDLLFEEIGLKGELLAINQALYEAELEHQITGIENTDEVNELKDKSVSTNKKISDGTSNIVKLESKLVKETNKQTKGLKEMQKHVQKLWSGFSKTIGTSRELLSQFGVDSEEPIMKVLDVFGVLGDAVMEVFSSISGAISETVVVVDQTGEAVKGASKATATAISTVEKATVILAIIGAAMKIVTAIIKAFDNTKAMDDRIKKLAKEIKYIQELSEKTTLENMENPFSEDRLRAELELRTELLGKLKEAIMLKAEEAKTANLGTAGAAAAGLALTFGTTLLATKIFALVKSNNLMKNASKIQDEINARQEVHNKLLAIANTEWNTMQKSQANSIVLLDEQNRKIQQQIDAELSKKPKKQDVNQLIEWDDQILENEIKKQYSGLAVLTSAVGDLFKEMSDGIADAMMSAFESGEDYGQAFDKVIGGVMRNMIKNIWKMNVLPAMLKPLLSKIYLSMGLDADGKNIPGKVADYELTADEMEEIKAESEVAKEKIVGSMSAMEDIANVFADSTGDMEGIKKGIAGASEESVTQLAGYWASHLQYQVLIHGIFARWEAAGYLVNMSPSAMLQLHTMVNERIEKHLIDISGYTQRTAEAVEALDDKLGKVIVPNGTDKGWSIKSEL